MPINDEAFAAKLRKIRSTEGERQRARFSQVVPSHAFSEESLASLSQDLNEAKVRATIEHPDYPGVARRLAELGVPDRADNGLIAHAMRDHFRLTSGMWSLYLAATPGGLTHSRFDALHQIAGEGGRARTHGLIAYLRFIGYISPDEAAGDDARDGRERRYRPTARMREAFRRYFADALLTVAPLWPEADAMAAMLADERAFDEMIVTTGEGLILLGSLARLHRGPSFNDFSRRKSGMVMLWVLLLSAPQTPDWPSRETFQVRIAEVARRAGVSRVHVQRLLQDGVAKGLLALDGAGGVRVRTALWQEINTYHALFIICMGACARNTLARLPALPEAARAAG